jgi:hypothetical protein
MCSLLAIYLVTIYLQLYRKQALKVTEKVIYSPDRPDSYREETSAYFKSQLTKSFNDTPGLNSSKIFLGGSCNGEPATVLLATEMLMLQIG